MGYFKQGFRQRTLIGVLFLTFPSRVAMLLVLSLTLSLLVGCTAIKDAMAYEGDEGPAYQQQNKIEDAVWRSGDCYPVSIDLSE